MSDSEWESLCDGCGKCCLHKLEDADTGEIHTTNVACRLLDVNSGRCRKYDERKRIVSNCLQLREDLDKALRWLPQTCAYRRIAEGKGLADWHPLVAGNKDKMIDAGVSVLGRIVSEKDAGDYEDHVVDWANE